jgi:hypothetical protein
MKPDKENSINDDIDDEADNFDVEEAISIEKVPVGGSIATSSSGINMSGISISKNEFKLGKIVK